MKTFIISDTHFNHKNVIEYCNRPFKNIEEMDNELINNWNNTVGKDDVIICLGDFCFGEKENIKKYAQKLNGHKILVRGNHDRRRDLYIEAGFQGCEGEIIINPDVYKNKKTIILSHKPRPILPDNTVNIHGHIHEKTLDIDKYDINKYFNVSVENIDFKPIEITEIIKEKNW